MNTALHITGVLFLLLALVHLIFPNYFKWKEELGRISLVNKQMMEVHTFFIALTVFLMGLLCLFYAQELQESSLGRGVSAGLAFFWACRLFIQWFWYSPALWKGKKLETSIHVLFTLLWLWCTVVFAASAGSGEF